MGSINRKLWFINLTQREFWPMWVYYTPVWIQHFWLTLKLRNPFFFLATNPGIDGFILSDSKYETLKLVPEKYRPKSVKVLAGTGVDVIEEMMEQEGISYPVILKPDIGFRGIKVYKIEGKNQLATALEKSNIPFLIQEYCAFPLELGIFYYRLPGTPKGCIPSITIKEFLQVAGNGKHTLGELVTMHPRAVLHYYRLMKKFESSWNTVLPSGQNVVLEAIGNHNLGTRFHDGSARADDRLCALFDELSHQMPGFYFGRFDIRTESWEALKDRGSFSILEVNGVGGEPTHIYDPAVSMIRAWKDLCKSWRIAASIAEKNIMRGTNRPSYEKARQLWNSYSSYRSSLSL